MTYSGIGPRKKHPKTEKAKKRSSYHPKYTECRLKDLTEGKKHRDRQKEC